MKKINRFFIIIFFILTFLLLSSCELPSRSEAKREQTAFNLYLDELFGKFASSDSLSLNYTLARPQDYGISISPPTLGQFTLDAMNESLTFEKEYLKQLKAFDYKLLTKDQQLSYDIIKHHFELDIQYEGLSLYAEVLGPTTGLQAQLPILLAEYNFYNRKEVTDYLDLLVDVKRYFSQICEFERLKSSAGLFMSDEVADNIIDQCKAFIDHPKQNYLIEYFNEKIEEDTWLTDSEKNAYEELNKENIDAYVIPAYEELIHTLQTLKGTGTNKNGLSYYPDGKAYYEYLVAAKTGTTHSIPELADLIEESLISSLEDMSAIIQKNPDVIDQLSDYHYIETDPERILNYLKSAIQKDFPAPPSVDCQIKYVHPSLQDYVSPAMYLIPPLDNYKDNIIYINNHPKYNKAELFPTVAHEGYPGHLYQCIYFRSKKHHPIRSVLGCLGYDEGWATYAELYSYQISGLDPDVAAILVDNMIATHCIYSRTDIGIHYEGWTYADAHRFLSHFVSASASKEIYQTLLEEPAIYLPYCVGYLEISSLRQQAQQKLGKHFDSKKFHQFLLDLGPCDFSIVQDRFNTWIK